MGTDSLYYIMDYSGNYYRTDKADQLVAVAGEQDTALNQHLMKRMVKKQWQKKEITLRLTEKRMTGFHLQGSRRSFIEMPGSI